MCVISVVILIKCSCIWFSNDQFMEIRKTVTYFVLTAYPIPLVYLILSDIMIHWTSFLRFRFSSKLSFNHSQFVKNFYLSISPLASDYNSPFDRCCVFLLCGSFSQLTSAFPKTRTFSVRAELFIFRINAQGHNWDFFYYILSDKIAAFLYCWVFFLAWINFLWRLLSIFV